MDCNQRLNPFHQTTSTLSGAISKRDVLHTFMQMRDGIALKSFFGFIHLGFMLPDGCHTCKEVAGRAQVIQIKKEHCENQMMQMLRGNVVYYYILH